MDMEQLRSLKKIIFSLGFIILLTLVLFGLHSVPGLMTKGFPPFSSPSASSTTYATKRPSSTPPSLPPTRPPAQTATPSPPQTIWLDPALPPSFVDQIHIPQRFKLTSKKDQALIKISLNQGTDLGIWTYVLVAPFPTLAESISSPELRSFWKGESPGLFQGKPIHVSESTLRVLSTQWGNPSPDSVQVLPSHKLLDNLWGDADSWAIIPFQKLNPRWKVIEVDHANPLNKDFQSSPYPLSFTIGISGPEAEQSLLTKHNLPLKNRHPEDLTHVIMTGVTAMVRDTASIMEENGIRYPGQKIADVLRAADMTHISNEVPFAEDCPSPGDDQAGYYFCSKDSYLELLDFVGTDIVELSGDHFGDWGEEAMHHTLDLYEEKGWLTYGGGRTYSDGLQPIKITHNGNQIAFIGCNAKAGAKYATASETAPGASRCDFAYMKEQIHDLASEGYLPIATMQHDEIYQYEANYLQQRDFRSLAESGAVIVSGSQAHQPQAMEFHEGAFIHYGLGNLFFDQHYLAQHVKKYRHADEAFIDRHTFYDNRHINTELIPIKFIDNAQSRLMTPQERKELLESVFKASSW